MNHLEMLKLTHIISASKVVLGEIDLDPGSDEDLNSIVQAKSILGDNTAFDVEWHGKVFVSPQFSSGKTSAYAEKLLVEYQLGNVKEAILITEPPLDSDLYGKLCENSDAHFLSKELTAENRTLQEQRTISRDLARAAADTGLDWVTWRAYAFYFGKNIKEFGNVFSDYGAVFIPYPEL